MGENLRKRYLLDLGVFIVYSTTSYVMLEGGSFFGKQAILQFSFWVLGFFISMTIFKMKTTIIQNKRLIKIAMGTITFLILIVFIFKPINGAYGWIQIGAIGTIQPVEFLKIISIWFLSSSLSHRQRLIQSNFIYSTFRLIFILGIQVSIVTIYPDLGNAAVLVLIILIMILISGINYLWTIILGISGVFGSVLTVIVINSFGGLFLPPHVIARFSVFQNPFIDSFGNGFQLINGYYAMFNGGLFGLGLGNSIQKKGFLQFAHTDFAFSILIEELGLLVGILVLGVLFFMICRIFLIGIKSNDAFNSMMCIGIGSLFLVSVFINLGGITGLIPLTGITFPFVSQGGSSLLMFSVCIGFVLNISADEQRKLKTIRK